MEVILELKPETERRVAATAAACGLSVAAYLTFLIEGAPPSVDPVSFSPDEFEADMDLLAEGSERLPILPPNAFSRESIYADHD